MTQDQKTKRFNELKKEFDGLVNENHSLMRFFWIFTAGWVIGIILWKPLFYSGVSLALLTYFYGLYITVFKMGRIIAEMEDLAE